VASWGAASSARTKSKANSTATSTTPAWKAKSAATARLVWQQSRRTATLGCAAW